MLSSPGWILLLTPSLGQACLRIQRRDGDTVAAEEQETGITTQTEQQQECRACGSEEPGNSRYFWPVTTEEDLKVVPCCVTGGRLSNATDCGRKAYQNRILGGVKSKEHEFPWHCALLHKDGSFMGCGAVLLSCDPVIIVTAAHCFIHEANPANILVACGAHTVDRPDPSPQDKDEVRLQVTSISRHSEFEWLTAHSSILGHNAGHPSGISLFENDIAVVKVEGELQCRKKVVWPACLPNPNIEYAGWSKTGLAGWGQTTRGGRTSKSLMKVNSPIVSDGFCERKVCQITIGPIGVQNCLITPSKICAGGVPDKGPCRGDSGGALLVQDLALQGWAAAGIVSYQPGNLLEVPTCGSDKFTVFTEISKYLPWIASQFNMLPPIAE